MDIQKLIDEAYERGYQQALLDTQEEKKDLSSVLKMMCWVNNVEQKELNLPLV